MMEKIKINMLSLADTVEGQGVGSAYKELNYLMKVLKIYLKLVLILIKKLISFMLIQQNHKVI